MNEVRSGVRAQGEEEKLEARKSRTKVFRKKDT